MSDKRVDYDRIASSYDQRFENGAWRGTATALLDLARQTHAERILEVGCGTGYWLAHFSSITDRLHGLDLSVGMLYQARRRDRRLLLTRGRAECLPFSSACFDLVYCVNALHHFDGQRDFVSEARRLLRPGGALAVVGMDPHNSQTRFYLYHYFEGAYETDLVRFPPWVTVGDWMRVAGFEGISRKMTERILDHKIGSLVLEDPFLRKDATSQLTLLSNEAYTSGLRRIRSAIEAAEAAGARLIFPVDIPIAMVVGRVKS